MNAAEQERAEPVRLSTLVPPERVEGRFALVEARNGPGWASEVNRHPKHSKVFHVLAGSYDVLLDGGWRKVRAGETLVVPAGSSHGFRAGSEGGHVLVVYPPESAGLLTAISELGGLSTLSPADRATLHARHGVECLGPLPERT